MQLPVQTSRIFKLLSKGHFISSNSSDKAISDLYKIIDANDTFERLSEYFRHINFVLERGNEYIYFSRPETKVELEKKVERAFEWIDIVDFFKAYNNAFSSGHRFSSSDILAKVKTDAELESKLISLNRYAGKETYKNILDKIIKKLVDDTFVEMENEITEQYKVLAAFSYLEELLLTINIPDDVKNEIPE